MNATGSFIWYELMTSDATAAAKFYGAVVGRKIADRSDPPGGDWVVSAVDPQGAAFGVVGPQGAQA